MDFIQQVKESADIVQVIGEYVRLKRVGASPRYVGLCPFHTEKTPSFSVHSAHQFYKCFGCGVGGDVFKFLMELEGLTFWEALTSLAEKNGIPLPKRSELADEDSKLRGLLYEMHTRAEQYFVETLLSPEGAEARAYLERRGLTPELVREFRLGFAPAGGQALVRLFERLNFPKEHWEASGLVMKRQEGTGYFDRFRGRVLFPIHNESGKTIAFGGRALGDEQPKYLNSPETGIYRKSYTLFNLNRAKEGIRRRDGAVLVEGYMDAIGAWSAGAREVVASCGTALTNSQVRSIKRHSTNVVVNFDPDAAGAAATERSIHLLLEEGMHIRVLALEGGLDPDDYVKRHGGEVYLAKIAAAPDYFTWMSARARQRFDTHTAEGRVAAFQFLLPSIGHVTDKIARAAIAADVAAALHIEQGLVLEQFRRLAIDRKQQPAGEAGRVQVPDTERFLLHCLLTNPETRREVIPRLRELDAIQGFETKAIFEAVVQSWDEKPGFTYPDLEARLPDNERALMGKLLFDEDLSEETASMEQALNCLRRLESSTTKSARSDLRRRIQDAERGGNLEEALRLMKELDALQ